MATRDHAWRRQRDDRRTEAARQAILARLEQCRHESIVLSFQLMVFSLAISGLLWLSVSKLNEAIGRDYWAYALAGITMLGWAAAIFMMAGSVVRWIEIQRSKKLVSSLDLKTKNGQEQFAQIEARYQ